VSQNQPVLRKVTETGESDSLAPPARGEENLAGFAGRKAL